SLTTYESLRPHGASASARRKVVLTMLIMGTIALIVWISYKNTHPDENINTDQVAVQQNPVVGAADTTHVVSAPATEKQAQKTAISPATPAGQYKFVIETANKRRAYFRYNTLRNGNTPVQIARIDSSAYQLYFNIAAKASDTARISDSLTTWYPAQNHQKAYAVQ
ncbi:MAG TPA: hypothetical protein VGC95_09050, partial [Chitinophagaceae bacterium]